MKERQINNGIIIKILRIIYSVKQYTIAQELKVSTKNIINIENDESDISINQLDIICNFFKITKNQFFELKEFIKIFPIKIN